MVPFLVVALLQRPAADTALDYIRLRKKYGVYESVGVEALDSFVGTRVLEIKGTVRGTCRIGDIVGIQVEKPNGEDEIITADAVPWFMREGEVAARLLIRATRETPTAGLQATLIGAAEESKIALAESRLQASQPRSKPRTRTETSRHTTAPRPGRTWSLPASEVTPIYAGFIHRINPRLDTAEAIRIAQGVVGFSLKFGVDARLVMAMVMVESGFNPNATSHAGAQGLGQLMPGTARGAGISNSYDSMENLYGSIGILRGNLAKYGKATDDGYQALVLSLAAYNAGAGAVKRHGGVPPYRETQKYVRKVIDLYYTFAGMR
jgi:soluble lytic murein transglycosylase-like protein